MSEQVNVSVKRRNSFFKLIENKVLPVFRSKSWHAAFCSTLNKENKKNMKILPEPPVEQQPDCARRHSILSVNRRNSRAILPEPLVVQQPDRARHSKLPVNRRDSRAIFPEVLCSDQPESTNKHPRNLRPPKHPGEIYPDPSPSDQPKFTKFHSSNLRPALHLEEKNTCSSQVRRSSVANQQEFKFKGSELLLDPYQIPTGHQLQNAAPKLQDEMDQCPAQPHPPECKRVTSNTLFLSWSSNATNNVSSETVKFRLLARKFGEKELKTIYEGTESEKVVDGLDSHSVYIFKVQTISAFNASPLSAAAAFRTAKQAQEDNSSTFHSHHNSKNHTTFAGRHQNMGKQPSNIEIFKVAEEPSVYHALKQRLEDYQKRMSPNFSMFNSRPVCQISVRRANLLEDSMECIAKLSQNELFLPLRVEYEDEPGIDSGGIVKDWFIKVSEALFSNHSQLFQKSSSGQCCISSPTKKSPERHVPQKKLVHSYFTSGRFLAKALLDGQTLGLDLDDMLLKFILQEPACLDDLRSSDKELHQSFNWMLENDISGIALGSFSIRTTDINGAFQVIDLKDQGFWIDINEENKHDYVRCYLNWLVNGKHRVQKDAFAEGFLEIVPRDLVQGFTALDIKSQLCGCTEICFDELQKNTIYKGGYTACSEQIVWFWEAVEVLDLANKKQLLTFWTGSKLISPNGLSPPLTITKAYTTSLEELPTSHTCFHQLALPAYDNSTILVTKLLFAINNTEGFFLT